ncbi:DNA-binding response regulator [Ktedonobacteria bacterium brp13]|nr:DNA-binding response regulator [Ktedonobacteria bacterium brp13]
MRILVIEDNHRLNSSLAASLIHEGYSVDSAYDGQEGQDLAEITPYDLILESNVIDVYVRRLRRKIDDPFAVKLLTTVRGVGYRLQPPPA